MVPVGTVVKQVPLEKGKGEKVGFALECLTLLRLKRTKRETSEVVLADLGKHGESIVVAMGGRGGKYVNPSSLK